MQKIYGHAKILGNVHVCDEAVVCDTAVIYDDVIISHRAKVCGNTEVYSRNVCDSEVINGDGQNLSA
ncbi:hypothetical protein CLPUN_42870 [Clostridium puniceum]|uniref:UDP-3-O-(3-hydroxymyristoyl)glucosamine N-acyltransferase n=1 Tax=Clostridium puniceum TaxID=29367 RepID=A0A1S8T868_9CLOT|nr:hypothetical protein [Clostridium puniceum]OOM73852.1 hypothetical protein CLPUN_42870 [Clostridium puniceum]